MTHTTEQERVDTTVFKRLLNDYADCLRNGDFQDAGAALLAVVAEYQQAARRTPVVSDAQIKAMFLANGFTIKENLTDLKPYVYQAARALLAEVSAPAAQMPEPAAKAVASNCFREKSECINNALPVGTKLYTEQQIRALLATSGQTQADAPDERKAFDAANLRDHFGDPLSYRERDIAFRAWQARAALAATQPTAQGMDAPNEWAEIHTLPTCDDLIWLYCRDTNTTDGPIAPEPNLEEYGWTHWAYANAPSTAWIDAAQAKKEGEKK